MFSTQPDERPTDRSVERGGAGNSLRGAEESENHLLIECPAPASRSDATGPPVAITKQSHARMLSGSSGDVKGDAGNDTKEEKRRRFEAWFNGAE